MKPVWFTQFLRPHGRTRKVKIYRPNAVAEAAEDFVGRGGRLECEVLNSGEITLWAEMDPGDDQTPPAAIEIVPNGPAVPEAVDRLINATRAALGRYAIRRGLDTWWDGTAWDESTEALSNAKRFPTVKAATLEIGEAGLETLPDPGWTCPVHDRGCRCRRTVRVVEVLEGETIPATPGPGPTGAEIAAALRDEALPPEDGESGPEPDGTLPDPPASG